MYANPEEIQGIKWRKLQDIAKKSKHFASLSIYKVTNTWYNIGRKFFN
jgi:hypothetical protein